MPSSDTYIEPAAAATAELKVKGSRFLGEVHPARDTAEAASLLAAIRRRYHDATHHCSAWRLTPFGDEFRYDDDGEPSGSAGPPILRQIDALGVTNVIVVVTRWFGGTKLGTGGLVRAYGDTAKEALGATKLSEHVMRTSFRLSFAFEDTSPAMHTLSRFDTETVDTSYGVGTEMTVAVRNSQAEVFEAAWIDALRGRGEIGRLSS